MRIALAALALIVAPTAQAGSLGLIFAGGAHTEQTWFYSTHQYGNGDPIPYTDPADYDQYELVQTLPHLGTGMELILGDRDDRILGSFRFYYQQDGAQGDPAELTSQVQSEHVVANVRDEARHIGMGMVGLSWGVWGDPSGFQLGFSGHVGSGFLTTDHTEFLAADIGPSATYKLNRQMQAFVDGQYVMRFRKGYSHGGQGVLGIRYLFD